MADNTAKIGVGIDVNALKDDLSQVESLFRQSTATVAELWADAGEKITEALAKVLSQATSTEQQSAAQMNGAASSVASFAEGAGAKLNVYLQVAILVIQAAKDIWEAHKRMREEAFNTEHQMAQLVLSFDGEAHSLEIANLKLDDQIGNSADQTVYTFTIPANTVQAGKGIRLKMVGFHSTGTAVTTYKMIIGATTTATVSTSSGNSEKLDHESL